MRINVWLTTVTDFIDAGPRLSGFGVVAKLSLTTCTDYLLARIRWRGAVISYQIFIKTYVRVIPLRYAPHVGTSYSLQPYMSLSYYRVHPAVVLSWDRALRCQISHGRHGVRSQRPPWICVDTSRRTGRSGRDSGSRWVSRTTQVFSQGLS